MKLATILAEAAVFTAPDSSNGRRASNPTIIDPDTASLFTVSIEADHALELIKQRCSDSIHNSPLFRGLRKVTTEYFASDSSQIERRSLDNPNHYTKLLSAGGLDSWKNYPPRDRSTICTTADTGESNEYGDTYVVFPENGTKIGICPSYDLWGSFKPLIRAAGQNVDGDLAHNLIDLFDTIDPAGTGNVTTQLEQSIRKFYPNVPMSGSLRDFLEKYMAPEFNNFQLVTPATMPTFEYTSEVFHLHSREVWFSGRAVYVRYDIWQQLKDQL